MHPTQPDSNESGDRPAMSRVLRSRQAARTAYDRLSRWYDWLAGSEAKLTRAALEMTAVQSGESVLEIGFGTGKSLLQLASQAGERGLVFGIDLSWGMAKVAARRIEKESKNTHLLLCLSDGAALPYPSGQFDAIFMAFTLELFDTPEIPRVLGECRRVLHAGGRLGIVSLSKPQRFAPMVAVYEGFHHHFPAAADCRPIPADACLAAAGFEIAAVAAPLDVGSAGGADRGKKAEKSLTTKYTNQTKHTKKNQKKHFQFKNYLKILFVFFGFFVYFVFYFFCYFSRTSPAIKLFRIN